MTKRHLVSMPENESTKAILVNSFQTHNSIKKTSSLNSTGGYVVSSVSYRPDVIRWNLYLQLTKQKFCFSCSGSSNPFAGLSILLPPFPFLIFGRENNAWTVCMNNKHPKHSKYIKWDWLPTTCRTSYLFLHIKYFYGICVLLVFRSFCCLFLYQWRHLIVLYIK